MILYIIPLSILAIALLIWVIVGTIYIYKLKSDEAIYVDDTCPDCGGPLMLTSYDFDGGKFYKCEACGHTSWITKVTKK